MRYEDDCPLPVLVKTVPHIAFEVDDVLASIKGRNVIIEPNSPSKGITVAFIEENGAPIEPIQINVSIIEKGLSVRQPFLEYIYLVPPMIIGRPTPLGLVGIMINVVLSEPARVW